MTPEVRVLCVGNLQHALVDLSVVKDGELVDHLGHHQLEGKVVSFDLTKLVVPFRWDVADCDSVLVCRGFKTTLKGAVDIAEDLEGQTVWQKPDLS